MKRGDSTEIDTETIVDQLYDIALDPKSLEGFIGAWNAAGLDGGAARKTIKSIDEFDQAYVAHLERAAMFLSRGMDAERGPDLKKILAPFDSLAAFIVDPQLVVVASNEGAQQAFGITDGVMLSALRLHPDVQETLNENLQKFFLNSDKQGILLRLENESQRGPALFQIRRLSDGPETEIRHALVVTTQYHWQAALGETLNEVFDLTTAEQGVVRALVEGFDAKAISAERGTSEGTVRGQIKSILSKMNARSQSEVIRLVLSLRDVSAPSSAGLPTPSGHQVRPNADWLHAEVWKPFNTLILPDGRKMDYHDMGPSAGAPILFTHMGYGMVRWNEAMLRLAMKHGLRVIVPIRAGYGQSDNLHPKADVLEATREDTRFLLKHLGITRLPYVPQGNDLLFAADFAAHFPEMTSEILGICARPSLSGDRHYAGMAKWHRFFLSTARHAPHLLKFTAKAAVAMAKRIGVAEMFKTMNQRSRADMALFQNEALYPVLVGNAELVAGMDTDVSQAYAMEILATESDWSDLMVRAKGIPTYFINGGDDPATDIATIAEYRETYPWVKIEVIPDAGQMLIFQHYETVIPRFAAAAKRAQDIKPEIHL